MRAALAVAMPGGEGGRLELAGARACETGRRLPLLPGFHTSVAGEWELIWGVLVSLDDARSSLILGLRRELLQGFWLGRRPSGSSTPPGRMTARQGSLRFWRFYTFSTVGSRAPVEIERRRGPGRPGILACAAAADSLIRLAHRVPEWLRPERVRLNI